MLTLTQVWGALLLFIVCPVLGGLPLIDWLTTGLTGKRLQQLGTGNISVSAAFYHGGRVVGILAVLSEALKGIAAVLLARQFFPTDPAWEVIALIALVMGRYWFARGAGTTNVTWGYVVHDPITAGLVFLIGGISFTLLRERQLGRLSILVLFPLITALRHPQERGLILAAIALALLIGWIYQKIPDDLDLQPTTAQQESRAVFRFFRGDRAVPTLQQDLDPAQFGPKAATLAALTRAGYPVPPGWLLVPGDDPAPLLALVQPSPKTPFIARSSAIGEDSEVAAAAGIYESVGDLTRPEELLPAIHRVLASYDAPRSLDYRQSRQLPAGSMAVLIQPQVRGVFSGVAFSRDPITRQGDAVLIEGLPGAASQVVSGQRNPERYRVAIADVGDTWQLPDDVTLPVDGTGDLPPRLVQQVAYLTRHIEAHFHGTPQDVEWSYDGQTLWVLQARPITTLLPLWTRKIAAEVIPGLIRPLTWSINRPLTCGVWGDLFTLVLQDRAAGLDFTETATLHHSRAYFNATLLGNLFRRMGLPAESLEFLTRGAKFSRPPLTATLRNVPGLLRLVGREFQLTKDFQADDRDRFTPALQHFATVPPDTRSPTELLRRIDDILDLLRPATYYSILAPLSAALRRTIARVDAGAVDNGATPEVAVTRSLQQLAAQTRELLDEVPSAPDDLRSRLAATPGGPAILDQLHQLIADYGYLSDVGTDIAVPTWREDPAPVWALFEQFCQQPPPPSAAPPKANPKVRRLQSRFDLKGRVTEVYSRLLAELRWSFLALEQHWLTAGYLAAPGDLFLLEFAEIRRQLAGPAIAWTELHDRIARRQAQLTRDRALEPVPFLVYGNEPPPPLLPLTVTAGELRGIGGSPGQIEGRVKVIKRFQRDDAIDRQTILVVPYTDSGWAPLLARCGGLIAEVGGVLSHGAIVAREYGIPAVMDIPNATAVLKDGQRVRLDGQQGLVEILPTD